MAWKGFVKESKLYMSYRRGNKIQFWLAFPRAWFRFNYFMLCDKIKIQINTLMS